MSEEVDGYRRFLKPILISYVRKEAETHAPKLKRELQELGFDVFLDVDEIEGGDDWVDALNHAVLNCQLFIPLITPKYGYTKWTNREIKLADVMKKLIIPVSFLDSWPPECLAIQLASTHYIPWKRAADIKNSVTNGDGERARDIRFWDDSHVRTVASGIADRYKRKQWILQPQNTLGSPFKTKSSLGVIKGRSQIVISAHPTEKPFIDVISEALKCKFKVWSSTDMSIGRFYSSNDNLMTPTVEGHTCILSPEDFDRARRFKDQVDDTQVVIIVLSHKYCGSRTSKQQAFYCDTRKRVIPIKFDELELPEWVSKLFDEDELLQYTPNNFQSFIGRLNQRVSMRLPSDEDRLNCLSSVASNEANEAQK